MVQDGFGQSVFYGVGGDSIIGTTSRDVLEILNNEPGTDTIIICGEIGGTAEEDAVEYAATMKKPVLSYITGRTAPKDKKMGHAGAIVTGNRGTYEPKRKTLERANVQVVDVPSEIGDDLFSVIGRTSPKGIARVH